MIGGIKTTFRSWLIYLINKNLILRDKHIILKAIVNCLTIPLKITYILAAIYIYKRGLTFSKL